MFSILHTVLPESDEIGDIAGVVITRALRANLESKVGDFEASLELSLKEIGVDYKDLTKRCS